MGVTMGAWGIQAHALRCVGTPGIPSERYTAETSPELRVCTFRRDR